MPSEEVGPPIRPLCANNRFVEPSGLVSLSPFG